jgi:hypothetical protein
MARERHGRGMGMACMCESALRVPSLKFVDILSTVWDLNLSHRWTDRTSAIGIFRRVRKIVRKATVSLNIFLFLSVRLPSTWNNMAPNGPIFIKFDVCIVFENPSRKLNFR